MRKAKSPTYNLNKLDFLWYFLKDKTRGDVSYLSRILRTSHIIKSTANTAPNAIKAYGTIIKSHPVRGIE